jgi:hypothetical protein
MFELVKVAELKLNQTYKMVGNGEYKGRLRNLYYYHRDEIYAEFDSVFNIRRQTSCPTMYCSPTFVYYRFVSDNPQWQMERRTVNLLVRRLIGDEQFKW